MTKQEEERLLKLAQENNYMLRQIVCFINQQFGQNKDVKAFSLNLLADIIGNKMQGD